MFIVSYQKIIRFLTIRSTGYLQRIVIEMDINETEVKKMFIRLKEKNLWSRIHIYSIHVGSDIEQHLRSIYCPTKDEDLQFCNHHLSHQCINNEWRLVRV